MNESVYICGSLQVWKSICITHVTRSFSAHIGSTYTFFFLWQLNSITPLHHDSYCMHTQLSVTSAHHNSLEMALPRDYEPNSFIPLAFFPFLFILFSHWFYSRDPLSLLSFCLHKTVNSAVWKQKKEHNFTQCITFTMSSSLTYNRALWSLEPKFSHYKRQLPFILGWIYFKQQQWEDALCSLCNSLHINPAKTWST